MSRTPWTTVTGAFRRTALPLASYYLVTLALPLANGAARSDTAFLKHALVVLVVPLAAIAVACAVTETLRSFTKSPAAVCDRREPVKYG